MKIIGAVDRKDFHVLDWWVACTKWFGLNGYEASRGDGQGAIRVNWILVMYKECGLPVRNLTWSIVAVF